MVCHCYIRACHQPLSQLDGPVFATAGSRSMWAAKVGGARIFGDRVGRARILEIGDGDLFPKS